jgi:hypothetical protein
MADRTAQGALALSSFSNAGSAFSAASAVGTTEALPPQAAAEATAAATGEGTAQIAPPRIRSVGGYGYLKSLTITVEDVIVLEVTVEDS